jgi:hypothetical protein
MDGEIALGLALLIAATTATANISSNRTIGTITEITTTTISSSRIIAIAIDKNEAILVPGRTHSTTTTETATATETETTTESEREIVRLVA